MNAVQGTRHAGATHVVAVDPVAFRYMAPTFGATECFASLVDSSQLISSSTNGQAADVVIVTVSVIQGDYIREAFVAIWKGGTVVVTAIGSSLTKGIPINLVDLALSQGRIQKVQYEIGSPRRFIA